MDLHHIRYFLAVCETKNFTRAAELCNVTQPALSRAIQQLEEESGGLLFHRDRQTVSVTELGMLMRPRLQQVVEELSKARTDARKFLTLEDAQITLGIMCSVGPRRFTALLGDFRLRYPGISVRLVEGSLKQLCARLESGDLDVAILADPEEYSERFQTRLLSRERFLVAFSTSHRFNSFDAVPVKEVDGENYLRRLNCEYREVIAGHIRELGCRINVCYQSEREDWIQNMAAGGLGICFIPEFSAAMPGLKTRPVVEPELWREVRLVTMAGRRLSPALLSFVKTVGAHSWPETPPVANAAA